MTRSDRDGAGALGAAGLTPDEEAVYELLIDGSPATTARIASLGAPAGLRADQLPAVLAALEAKGLVTRSGAHYAAVAPEAALDVLLVTAERELLRARERAGELDQAFQRRRAAGETPPAVVEVVTGQRAVQQRHAQIQRAAWHQLRCFSKPPYFDPPGSVAAQRELLDRGVTSRMIYERGFVDRIGALRQIETMVGAGQQARVLPSLPMKLYLMDDRFALLLLRHHPDEPDADAALVVHPSGLLEALSRLFEGLWQRALPLRLRPPAPGAAPPARARASAHDDERLIALLVAGLTDEAIARQLGVGYRTAERRIANLMSRLGAHTRFQAGVQAAFRHPPPPEE
ncbi:helix-turn-helix transcriptional regulator [Nonomuraea aurantiaca]|jgi:DNA-binding CsgD family transcriptional regulator|uniref:helix-turn-helix transcriptional regulator n=1 Tax=Nonomuraea aurantiaca TaxID=2878562 RepID=UPI001CD96960|nr:LuxR family transcriptional regulator [Nonomuraea aurantiaca]MCA2221993.1 LuxR C-terminal-related transcriptional regulator [Nonomuraea aurantiaca]